jgi:conjugal transfer pilus assembly protein TraU
MKKIKTLLWIVSFYILLIPNQGYAKCDTEFVNPLTDVNWSDVFPIRLMGMIISPSGPEKTTIIRSPFCSCKDGGRTRFGVVSGFWEPVRLVDVVKDAYCMAGMGFSLQGGKQNIKGGGGSFHGATKNREDDSYFAQSHVYVFLPFYVLNLLSDFTCASKGDFSVLWLSEFDPTWNDGLLQSMLEPEALLFSNPAAALSCMAESVTSTVGWPIDSLFWCQGSWGGTYPLTGGSSRVDPARVESSAQVAGKVLYKMHRTLQLMQTAGESALCGPHVMPVWRKSQYKMQIVRPVKGGQSTTIGRPSIIWGNGKNTVVPGKGDNFTYLLWRNRDCCAF